jgi:hypothetical protein
MTEAKEFSAEGPRVSSGNKKGVAKTLALAPSICVICEICGFIFGVSD